MNEEFIELTQYNTLPISIKKASIDGFYRRDGMGLTRILISGSAVEVKETYAEIQSMLFVVSDKKDI